MPQVGTLTFLAPSELEAIAAKVAELVKANPTAKDYESPLATISPRTYTYFFRACKMLTT